MCTKSALFVARFLVTIAEFDIDRIAIAQYNIITLLKMILTAMKPVS